MHLARDGNIPNLILDRQQPLQRMEYLPGGCAKRDVHSALTAVSKVLANAASAMTAFEEPSSAATGLVHLSIICVSHERVVDPHWTFACWFLQP